MPTKFMKLSYKPLRTNVLSPLTAGGRVIGYEFPFYLNYYRGIHLSGIREFEVTIDGEKVEPFCALNGKIFTPAEFPDLYKEWWSPKAPMTINVYNNAGLTPGEHQVHVTCQCICASMKFAPGVYAMIDSSDSALMTAERKHADACAGHQFPAGIGDNQEVSL